MGQGAEAEEQGEGGYLAQTEGMGRHMGAPGGWPPPQGPVGEPSWSERGDGHHGAEEEGHETLERQEAGAVAEPGVSQPNREKTNDAAGDDDSQEENPRAPLPQGFPETGLDEGPPHSAKVYGSRRCFTRKPDVPRGTKEPRSMSRVVAVAGGVARVGTTTTVLHVAEALRISGQSTLILDLDPEGDAAQVLGIPRSRSGILEGLLVGDESPERAGLLVRSVQPGLDLIPGDVTMTESRLERPRGRVLKTILQDLAPAYPWILLDCPPSVGWLTRTACAAADLILVPCPGARASTGLPKLGPLKELSEIVDLWVLPTRYEGEGGVEGLRHAGRKDGVTIAATVIPEDPDVMMARSRGETVFSQSIEGRAARAYAQLVKEITRHDRQKTR